MDAFVAAVVGFVIAAVLALINSWLSGREKVAEGVRAQRLTAYPTAWRRTGVLSRWPRTDASREHIVRLHEDLRRWYYGEGGMYLSTRARKRYEHLQLVLESFLSQPGSNVADHYVSLMEAASYFRTGLTKDLETRERWGSIATMLAWREESEASRRADARLHALRAAAPRSPGVRGTGDSPIHHLTPEDEHMDGDAAPSTTDQGADAG
jgi:hypothetical protein